MNKIKNLVWIFAVVILFALAFVFYRTYTKNNSSVQPSPVFSDEFINNSKSFSDGLNNPDSITTYTLDEYGIGTSEKSIYYADINKDKTPDRITKTFVETGNAHSYYEYKIELNINGKYVDITPNNLRTINGDTCDLQQIQFIFKPQFKIILISRELGETWTQPTLAKKQIFNLSDKELKSDSVKTLSAVCDVKELF